MKTETLQHRISPQDFYHRRCEGLPCEIIDVRTTPEFTAAHVSGSRSVPLHLLNAENFLRQPADDEAPLFVLCQSGARAAKAVDKLRRAGCDSCVLIEGGIDAWMAAGLPVERGKTRVWPLQRQVHLVIGLSAIAGAVLAIAVDKWFALIPFVTGCGLTINGVTGWCGLALLLAKMPWNRCPESVEVCCGR